MYLKRFEFPSIEQEDAYLSGILHTCYTGYYPYRSLSNHYFFDIEFEPITILYGGNGSGKSTVLNVIAEALMLDRGSLFNKTPFFDDYVSMCSCTTDKIPNIGRIITSDDVFNYILDLRAVNDGVNLKREELFEDWSELKYGKNYNQFQMRSLADYDLLKKANSAKRLSQSEFVRENSVMNVREHSNGESAFKYFIEKITDNGLYLLDEPENSLSVKNQLELFRLIDDSARFFNCQFIIATHSPFSLSLKGAKIYDLDSNPVVTKKWTELESIKLYYEFFRQHEDEFTNSQM